MMVVIYYYFECMDLIKENKEEMDKIQFLLMWFPNFWVRDSDFIIENWIINDIFF